MLYIVYIWYLYIKHFSILSICVHIYNIKSESFIYLFIHERHIHRERDRDRDREREKQVSCREPDAGLDPGSPGSRPGPKAGTKLLSHLKSISLKSIDTYTYTYTHTLDEVATLYYFRS